ncbi:PD-(D/E)XK endonuclease-like domain-containing protein [Plasmodiophora brassicae]
MAANRVATAVANKVAGRTAAPCAEWAGRLRSRHEQIEFRARKHSYSWQGRLCTSVTTHVASYFPKFDADAVLDSYFDRWQKDPSSKYYGLERHAIKALWSSKGLRAATSGTSLHAAIERYWNGDDNAFDGIDEQTRNQFAEFVNNAGPFQDPVLAETRIVDPELLIAGTVDCIMPGAATNSVIMYDWKRTTKALSPDAPSYGKRAFQPISKVPDTSYSKYSIQLNLYKDILERVYDIEVEAMFLVQLSPQIDTYVLTPVPDMPTEINAINNHRKAKLERDRIDK